jgi:glycosyltransferase involved in cell wall biosynthesis
MANKILFISQVFYPDEVSTANLFTNLCSELIKNEVEVEVWCAHPSYTTPEKQARKKTYNGIKINYLPSTNFRKSIFYGRLINYISFTFSVMIRLIMTKDKIPVFTHTTPPFLGIFISFICFLKKRKFVFILLDIFPEGLIRLGKLSRGNLLVRFWQRLFISSLRHSFKIIVIGRDMMKWIGDLDSSFVMKMEYIPLWQDDELIQPKEFSENSYVLSNKLKNRFVVQYSGNMGLWNDMQILGKMVQNSIDDSIFMFVGGGMRKSELVSNADPRDYKNMILIPFQSNEIFKDILTACHVALVTLRKNLEGMAVPSKIYGIMAAGIPVIAIVPNESEIAFIIKEENCGVVVNPGDSSGLQNALRMIRIDENARKIFGMNGRRAFEEKYTCKKISSRYQSVIMDL